MRKVRVTSLSFFKILLCYTYSCFILPHSWHGIRPAGRSQGFVPVFGRWYPRDGFLRIYIVRVFAMVGASGGTQGRCRGGREKRGRGTCIWVDRVTRSNRFFPHDRPGNTWPCSDRRCRAALPHNISSRRHTFLLRLQSTQLISASISRFRFSHIRVEKMNAHLLP